MFFLLILLLFAFDTVHAQGLKGARMPEKIMGRLTYINGQTDEERWKTFLSTQPKLIGMSLKQVEENFGPIGVSAPNGSFVEYGLTETPVKSGISGKSWLHIKISFRNGVAWKYAVEAIE
jgi:hypothetical protein